MKMKIKYRIGFIEYDTFTDAENTASHMLKTGHLFKLQNGQVSCVVPIQKITIDGITEKVVGTFYINQLRVDQNKG